MRVCDFYFCDGEDLNVPCKDAPGKASGFGGISYAKGGVRIPLSLKRRENPSLSS